MEDYYYTTCTRVIRNVNNSIEPLIVKEIKRINIEIETLKRPNLIVVRYPRI